MMKRVLPAALALAAAACAASPGVDGAGTPSASALSTSLGEARACALRDAYLTSTLRDFTVVELSSLTGFSAETKAAYGAPGYLFATFQVPSYGPVVLAEYETTDVGAEDTFFTMQGEMLAQAHGTASGFDFGRPSKTSSGAPSWTTIDPLACATEQPPGAGPNFGSDAGADGGFDDTPSFDASTDCTS